MKKIRCAIYTRKSAEEGLEQEFNSLDAQREACAAYVASPSCPKTQTNSRLARRDVSDQRRLRLGWPMEARILGHEEAEPALEMVGRRHRWLDPA